MKKLPVFIRILLMPFLGIASGFITYFSLNSEIVIPRLEFVLTSIISSSATISGFVLASVTILVGASNKPIMVQIRKAGALKELKLRYTITLILGLIVIIYFTLAGLYVSEDDKVPIVGISISVGIIVMYIASIISTSYYLLSIIGLLNEETISIQDTPSVPSGEFRGNE